MLEGLKRVDFEIYFKIFWCCIWSQNQFLYE